MITTNDVIEAMQLNTVLYTRRALQLIVSLLNNSTKTYSSISRGIVEIVNENPVLNQDVIWAEQKRFFKMQYNLSGKLTTLYFMVDTEEYDIETQDDLMDFISENIDLPARAKIRTVEELEYEEYQKYFESSD